MSISDQEKIELLEKNFKDFIKVVAHDLVGPVRIMSSYTELLERSLQDKLSEKEKEYIAAVKSSKDNFLLLMGALNDYSALATMPTEEKESVSILEVLEKVVEKFNNKIIKNNIQVSIEGDFPNIEVDKGQIHQLFHELIDNAIKFTDKQDKPKIKISVETIENNYVFSIQDNGIGIHERCFSRIFLLFTKMHLDGVYPGSGVGLANAKLITEAHGGKLWVESEESNWSRFSFSLPIDK